MSQVGTTPSSSAEHSSLLTYGIYRLRISDIMDELNWSGRELSQGPRSFANWHLEFGCLSTEFLAP